MKVARYYLDAADARRDQLEFEHEVTSATSAEVFSRDLVCSCNGAGPVVWWKTIFEHHAHRVEVSRGSVLTAGYKIEVVDLKGHKLAKERRVKDSAQALVLVVQSLRKTNTDEVTP